MQTSFYASGFLYSLKTHQILLLQAKQENDIPSLWSTMVGESRSGEQAQTTFQRMVHELLNLDLKESHIYPVYDYFHDAMEKINFVFYAEVKSPKEFASFKGKVCSWVSFSETLKFLFTENTKQDVIVGQRVINAKSRADEAKITGVASWI